MPTTPNTDPAVEPDTGGDQWKHVLILSTGIVAIVLVALMVVQEAFIPPIAVFLLLAAVGVFVLRTRQKAGGIMLAIVSALFLAFNLPFIVPALSVPESSVDFFTSSISVLGLVGMVVSSIAVIRRRGGPGAMRFAGVLSVLGLLVVAGMVVARLAYERVEPQPGDLTMVLQDIQFSPQEIDVGGGEEISIFLDNKDTVLHTFTIEELDVDVDIPGSGSARVTFDAEPGTYEFICVPHQPDMAGTLRVGD